MWAQRSFCIWTLKTMFYQNKYHWCSCKVSNRATTNDWSQHPHMSSQQNKNMITSHSDNFLHSLVMSILHSSCVYINKHPCWLHVYSYFDYGWLIPIKLIKLGCLGSKGSCWGEITRHIYWGWYTKTVNLIFQTYFWPK
jgi:hypothetical protein